MNSATPFRIGQPEVDRVLTDLATHVQRHHGTVWVVGGAVLAYLQQHQPTDIDLEIHGLELDVIESVLATVFSGHHISTVGKIYGIYQFRLGTTTIEVAAPRRDQQSGPGHRDVRVTIDPTLDLAAAAARRDFTIDAIYLDLATGKIVDPFDGQADFAHHQLRVVSPTTFSDDPLRVLRAIQLAGRYALTAEPATLDLLRATVIKTAHLPRERFFPEWEKLFLKSPRPSLGLQLALDIGYFAHWAPRLDQLARTAQEPRYHPEGTAWVHTLMVVDNVRRLAPDNLPLLVAALCHDIGKATATARGDDGRIHTYGHEEAGLAPSIDFLQHQGFPATTIDRVARLVQEHMRPFQLYAARDHLGPGAIRRLANRLDPATIPEVATLALADYFGRSTDEYQVFVRPAIDWLLQQATTLNYHTGRPEPVVRGRDLVARGWTPGPAFQKILSLAEQLAEQGLDRPAILKLLEPATSLEAAAHVLGQAINPSAVL